MYEANIFKKKTPRSERVSSTHLHHRLVRLELDVGYAGIDHERNQVHEQIGGFAENRKCGKAKLLEPVVMWRLHAAHRIDHLLGQLDCRRVGLRVASKNVTKVNCIVTKSGLPIYYSA